MADVEVAVVSADCVLQLQALSSFVVLLVAPLVVGV